MIAFHERHGDDSAPGPWWKACTGWEDGRKRAVLRMTCGHTGTLGLGHTVAGDGTVTPSVVCPKKAPDGTPCPFHEHLRLEGWKP